MNKSKTPLISSDLIVMAVFGLLGLSLIWNTTRVIYRNYELQQQVDQLTAEIEVVEIENQNLTYNIEYYQTDSFLELEAREKFNKARPGEKLVLLPKDFSLPDQESSTPAETDDQPQYRSNFSAWWEFLFGALR